MTARVDERLLAAVLFAAVGVFGVLGSVGESGANGFDLDAEVNFPALFSASLLAAAAALTLLAGQALATGWQRLAWGALSAGLLLLACDEFIELHEKLESAVGVDWQLLYAPIVAVLVAAFLVVLRSVWPIRSTRFLLLAAATAWSLSQALEQAQWDGEQRVSAYRPMMVSEELLEMAGSGLFVLAMLTAIRVAAQRTQTRAEPSELELADAADEVRQ